MSAHPNILVLMADQLSQRALRAYGNQHSCTPNLDRLAERAARFTDCYTTTPLCTPARAALWTGRFPHETGVMSNGWHCPIPQIPETMPTVGQLFAAAGYEAAYFGKGHDAGALRGFQVTPMERVPVEPVGPWPVSGDTFGDRGTTEQVIAYLASQPRSPFLAVASLANPHNICGYVGEHQGPHDDPAIPDALPPLLENFRSATPELVPNSVRYVCCAHNRQAQTAGWTEENYRHYLAAYYHYMRRVDAEIGRILDALAAMPGGEETLVLFLADHGDGMGAHGLVTKHTTFYDEATRVPCFVAGPGIAPGERGGLTSLLDMLPTLCDCAGIAAPEGLWGRSLRPWLTGEATDSPHPYVVSEWHTEWGFTTEPGRMVRTPGFKYTRYAEDSAEELYDLAADPGETRSLITTPAHAETLAAHRALLEQHTRQTADPFFSLEAVIDPRWRSHPPGCHPAGGPAAPMVK